MGKPVIRTERGWGAHFCLADRCAFRRNTLLECGDQRIVVSTVGAMSSLDGTCYDAIGHNRHFETMAFHAVWEDPYWDVDVMRQLEMPCASTLSGVQRNSDSLANEMHEAAVSQFMEALARGSYVTEEEDMNRPHFQIIATEKISSGRPEATHDATR